MGKKKFFDKKKSATFQLMARDTSDPNYSSEPSGDRVFVRIDNNQYTPSAFEGQLSDCDLSADPDSIFADAPEDYDDEDADDGFGGVGAHKSKDAALPDHIRREMLELGFPDDGYNYLTHLREIKNTGGGSTYFPNPKAESHKLPQDVKAYDASRVEVSEINDAVERSVHSVASNTIDVRLHKVLDPEIAAMLDDSNSSNFGFDVEDLEEDFVVKANFFEGRVDEELDDEKLIGDEVDEKLIGEELNEKLSFAAGSRFDHLPAQDSVVSGSTENRPSVSCLGDEKPRARRPLDEQFDLLELDEYGAEIDEEFMGYMDEEECKESLAEKLSTALKDHPSNVLHLKNEAEDTESPELTAEVIRRCIEYAEKYRDEDDQEEVLVEASSDESEVWDCETIVTTYSTLDNHPGKIGAPETRRKKKLAEALSGSSAGTNQVITLKGKERLPVDFLPGNRRRGEEKTKDEKDVNNKKSELEKKPRAQESKEEKKERKSAVKLERREARQLKKEMKVVYKSEGQRAQKVAAFTGPSSIHLM